MPDDAEGVNPWDIQPGEGSLWFSRFSAFRLMGTGRSLLGCYRQDLARKGKTKKKPRVPPGSWLTVADCWDWRGRAEAWDCEQLAAVNAAKEAEFRAALEHHHREAREAARLLTETAVGHLRRVQERVATIAAEDIHPDAIPSHLRAAAYAVEAGLNGRAMYLGVLETLKALHREDELDAKNKAKLERFRPAPPRPPAPDRDRPDPPAVRPTPGHGPGVGDDDLQGFRSLEQARRFCDCFDTQGDAELFLARFATGAAAYREVQRLKREGRWP
jgi:hypothetical protein